MQNVWKEMCDISCAIFFFCFIENSFSLHILTFFLFRICQSIRVLIVMLFCWCAIERLYYMACLTHELQRKEEKKMKERAKLECDCNKKETETMNQSSSAMWDVLAFSWLHFIRFIRSDFGVENDRKNPTNVGQQQQKKGTYLNKWIKRITTIFTCISVSNMKSQ